MSTVDPKKLTPNPANRIFDPLPEDVYQALKEDIGQRGLLNPILTTPDFTIIAGHHRLKAALELGLDTVPVEIHDVDAGEAERLLIADNVLRRQLNPMEQARLIQRLKEQYGIQKGRNNSSRKMREEATIMGISEDTAGRLNKLNDLIPALQALVSAGKLGTTHGAALATLSPDQQQALFDAIGESITRLKVADIQQAKKAPDTSALEAHIATLETERDTLQTQIGDQPDADQIAALQACLQTAVAERQAVLEEVERLRTQRPIDRIVQRIVPDPAQTRRIEELEAHIAAFQPIAERMEQHDMMQKDIARLETEKKAAASQLHSLHQAIQRLDEISATDPAEQGRVALTQFITHARTRLRALRDEWETIAQMDPAPLVSGLQPDIRALLQILQELGDGLTALPHQPALGLENPAPVLRPFPESAGESDAPVPD